MTKEEILVRQIIGPGKNEITGFICAVRETGRLLFEEGRALGEIMVTRDIYPVVAQMTQKNIRTAARQVERVGNLCWESLDRNQKLKYIGRELSDIGGPQDMLFYLAFYLWFQKPFYEILEEKFYDTGNFPFCSSNYKILTEK